MRRYKKRQQTANKTKTTATRTVVCFGAENGARTRDLNLGKVALYQLSYFRKTLLLSVGIAKIDTFFESPKFFYVFSHAFLLTICQWLNI